MIREADRRKSNQFNKALLVVIVLAVFAAAVIIIVSVADKSKNNASAKIGEDYIKTMEAKNTAEIENNIFNASRQKLLDEMQERLDDNPGEVWQILNELNTVILGDSRAAGFFVFDYMDESRVLAYAGATIRNIPDDYEAIRTLNPGLLLLSYGINDINSYWLWDDVESYLEELGETVSTLKEMLPNAYIYVQSTFPVVGDALIDSPNWANIPGWWNESIKEFCLENDIRYLDLSDLIAEYMDAYDIDGIHIQSYFYPHWAEALVLRYLADST